MQSRNDTSAIFTSSLEWFGVYDFMFDKTTINFPSAVFYNLLLFVLLVSIFRFFSS
ncbi:hypothetical protein [Rummeliibacillus suwonensis]|uniref:hypothetical protein n=1 Tax=Rummeliibacillus suwonensis TaxID=1306154 RepID=UPI001646BE05|nr:hypothetical protein [Rummeliibacillus suwonensis]MBO2534697.1 hypothetical protein [Rummeliibacillus suwonensis]